MNPQITALVFFGLFLSSAVHSFELLPSRNYYDVLNPDLSLTCGNGIWNKDTQIQFFGRTNKDSQVQILFDSKAISNKYILGSVQNQTIFLDQNVAGIGGWSSMYCRINKIQSINTMTIPYVAMPIMRFTSLPFKMNSSYVMQCVGSVTSADKMSIDFMFNGRTYASISDGVLTRFPIEGLIVIQGLDKKNSIMITPTSKANHGIYSCGFTLSMRDSKITKLTSNQWKTQW